MSKKVFYGIFFLLLVSITGVVGLMLSSADMDSPFKAPLPKVIASARLPHPEKIRIQKNKCRAGNRFPLCNADGGFHVFRHKKQMSAKYL